MSQVPLKSLDDVARDMSALYDAILSDKIDLKKADSLANVAGKRLKAEQLALAKVIFANQIGKGSTSLPGMLA